MRRTHTGFLFLLALLLLLEGRPPARTPLLPVAGSAAPPLLQPSGDVSAAPPVAATAAGLAAADVARIVAGANPELSAAERDRIGAAVVRFGRQYGLEPELILAVILVESGARPWVRSPKGAVGLMQVMPQQTARLGLPGNAATIESNVEAGCAILAENIDRYGEARGILTYFWGSNIGGDAYLERVQAARAEVRRRIDS
jgi:soluble lytic murein transglycosylase-like protein